MTAAVLHATMIARWREGGWQGLLLRGRSGAGKSGLALAAMRAGWRLVADDRTVVWRSGDALYGKAPATLAGLVEARGLGIAPASALRLAQVRVVADLAASEAIERMPDPAAVELEGVVLPRISLWPHDAAAEPKLLLALEGALACAATSLGVGRGEAYQARRAEESPNGPSADGGLG